MKKLIVIALVALLIQGCNTVAGLGKDLTYIAEKAGTQMAEQQHWPSCWRGLTTLAGGSGQLLKEQPMFEKRKKTEKTRYKKKILQDDNLLDKVYKDVLKSYPAVCLTPKDVVDIVETVVMEKIAEKKQQGFNDLWIIAETGVYVR